MKVYSRRSNPVSKEPQSPFFEAKTKTHDSRKSFFGKSTIQRKEDTSPSKAEEEMKNPPPQKKEPDKEKINPKEQDGVTKLQKNENQKEDEVVQKASAPEKEKKEKEPVQKKTIRRKSKDAPQSIRKQEQPGAKEATPELEQRLQLSKGKGFALPDALLNELGTQMNCDFSQVRIHTDAEAIAMAEALNAQAFTHGNDIYFNAGQYAPHSAWGRQLLIHELTHIKQQSY